MSHNYAGVLLGVFINEEQWARIYGSKQEGLLDKYGRWLHDEDRYEKFGVPAGAQNAKEEYLGFFLFTGEELLIEHYQREFGIEGTPMAKPLPGEPRIIDTLHLSGLYADAQAQWALFAEFCQKHDLPLGEPQLLLVVDKE